MAWALWANSMLLTDMRSGTTSQRCPWALSGGMPLISVTHAPCRALQILWFVLSRLRWKRSLGLLVQQHHFGSPPQLTIPWTIKLNSEPKSDRRKERDLPTTSESVLQIQRDKKPWRAWGLHCLHVQAKHTLFLCWITAAFLSSTFSQLFSPLWVFLFFDFFLFFLF